MRARFNAARTEVRNELAAIGDLEERLESRRGDDECPALARAQRLPSLRMQARIGGLGDHYALGYTFDSETVAHPNAMAAEQLLSVADGEEVPTVNRDAVHTLPSTTGSRARDP
jgi:hypothetical protein